MDKMMIISKTKRASLKGLCSIASSILLILCFYFGFSILSLKKQLSRIDKIKEKEFNEKVIKEKEIIRKDFEGRNAAVDASLRAMAKGLEFEKQKRIELENKLKEIETEKEKGKKAENKK